MSTSDEEPEFIRNDPGLACLLSQLDRVNQQIKKHERFKQQVLQAKQLVEEAANASLNNGRSQKDEPTVEWEKHWDDAVGAEYYFNPKTGEASWLPPSIKK